jgi:cytochrome c-type biogenesis protein CcmH
MSGLFGFLVLVILLLAAVLTLVLPPLFGQGADAAAATGESNPAASALAVLREQLAELDAEHAAGNLDAVAYAEAHDELERRVLEEGEGGAITPQVKKTTERGWIFTLALGVPLLALVGYLLVGTPLAFGPPPLTGQEQLAASFAARAGELVTHLAAVPDDADGWEELAILRVELNDAAGAADALSHLSALRPDDADVLVIWAVAVAMRDQTLEGEAETLLRRALLIDPEHPRAQAMLRNWEQRREQ